MFISPKSPAAHPFVQFAKGWGIALSATMLVVTLLPNSVHAQYGSCSLGNIKERVAPQYPIQLQGRILEGTVTLLATFAPDGRVTISKAFTGPGQLRFEAQAYVNGWRADPSNEQRQCAITIDFRFDGSQGVCSKRTEVHARAERLDDTHVLLHLNCDIW